MRTFEHGNISEVSVIKRFLELGYTVSIPYGNSARYDLIVEKGGTLETVQVKTGKLKNGVIRASLTSVRWDTQKRSDYKGQVSYIVVYCPDTDKCYKLIPEDFGIEVRLRIIKTKNNQDSLSYWAETYVL